MGEMSQEEIRKVIVGLCIGQSVVIDLCDKRRIHGTVFKKITPVKWVILLAFKESRIFFDKSCGFWVFFQFPYSNLKIDSIEAVPFSPRIIKSSSL